MTDPVGEAEKSSLPLDISSIRLKVGFEIHQQLKTKNKLFCSCCCEEDEKYEYDFVRKLRPTQSELGSFDEAALFEFSKMQTAKYFVSSTGSSCLVEADEEPPHEVNAEALESALIFSLALNSSVMDEIHVMRKIVIDGSNTSGFQRTMLVALGGHLEVKGKRIGVQSISLEEDAAKLISDKQGMKEYGLDRLGIPLVEIALEPVTDRPSELKEIAHALGRLLRSSKRVARGLGSIRQDVNVSVLGGSVVEVKGVQKLDQLVSVIEYESMRQYGLALVAKKLAELGVQDSDIGDKVENLDQILKDSASKIVKKILAQDDSTLAGIRVKKMAGMLGFEPYPGIRLGKELGQLVKFYGIEGVFHSDELPAYGITQEEVESVKQALDIADGKHNAAFIIVGGPKGRVERATEAVIARLKMASNGVQPETRSATADGKTLFSRPRPGAARMYPETDIPTVHVSKSELQRLIDRVPRPWDEIVEGLSKKYGMNKILTEKIFDSDYLDVFERIVQAARKISPTFIASKLTEDLISLERQGLDPVNLTEDKITEIFRRLDAGDIAKESVVLIFQNLMKDPSTSMEEAIRQTGSISLDDEEISKILDKVIRDNASSVEQKGMGALGMLMGRSMEALRGKADGQKINSMLRRKLESALSKK